MRQVLEYAEGDLFSEDFYSFASISKLTLFIYSNSENRLARQREDIEWPEEDNEDAIEAEIDDIEVTPDIPINHNCNFNAKKLDFFLSLEVDIEFAVSFQSLNIPK